MAGETLHPTKPPARRLATAGLGFHDSSVVEIFVIIIPPFIALIIGAIAVFAPRPKDPVVERVRINERIAWLEERLTHARAGNWDEQMMENLNLQMEAARKEQRELLAA